MFLNIKIGLIRRGRKGYEFAAQLGIPPSALSEIIAGRRECEPALRARMAEILGFDQGWLFARSAPPRAIPAAFREIAAAR